MKYSTVLWLLELQIRRGRKVQTQVLTVNSNSRTSNWRCNLFSKKNPIIRIFWISGWLAVPVNPDQLSSGVYTRHVQEPRRYSKRCHLRPPFVRWSFWSPTSTLPVLTKRFSAVFWSPPDTATTSPKIWPLTFSCIINIIIKLSSCVCKVWAARIPQSVQQLTTGWKVWGSNSGEGRHFPHPSRPALVSTQPPIRWVPGLSRG